MANAALVWIRDDFRIQNNDALTYATNQHDVVTAVFIFNSNIFDRRREAQKWWVSKSLENFKSDLKKLNIGLEIIKDDEINFFSKIKSNSKISVYWNKVYEPNELEKDKKLVLTFQKKILILNFLKEMCLMNIIKLRRMMEHLLKSTVLFGEMQSNFI
jgi:deoxyribodipyrimidine photo-lyase